MLIPGPHIVIKVAMSSRKHRSHRALLLFVYVLCSGVHFWASANPCPAPLYKIDVLEHSTREDGKFSASESDLITAVQDVIAVEKANPYSEESGFHIPQELITQIETDTVDWSAIPSHGVVIGKTNYADSPIVLFPNRRVRKYHYDGMPRAFGEVDTWLRNRQRGVPQPQVYVVHGGKVKVNDNNTYHVSYVEMDFVPGRELGDVAAAGEVTQNLYDQYIAIRRPQLRTDIEVRLPAGPEELTEEISGQHTNIKLLPNGRLIQYDPF